MVGLLNSIGTWLASLGNFVGVIGAGLGTDNYDNPMLAGGGGAGTPNMVADWLDGLLAPILGVLAPTGGGGVADLLSSTGANLIGGIGTYLIGLPDGGMISNMLALF